MKRACITGGGGYVGDNLAFELQKDGWHTVLLDLRFPGFCDLDPELTTKVQGSVTNYETVEKAVSGCQFVCHIAALGMSGKESLNSALVYEVNVNGTENILKACLETGCPYIVHISTSDVVFSDQEIINGDETLPYLPPNRHPDSYGPTKTIAEKLMLTSDGTTMKKVGKNGEKILRTAAVRFHGIYGPGEPRITERMFSLIDTGMVGVYHNAQIQFGSVANCVQGILKAYQGLQTSKKHIASGQAYFIVDGPPVDSILFWEPIFEALGKRKPTICIPWWCMYCLAFICEWLYRLFGVEPMVLHKDINHATISHYFSIEKARKELGYEPVKPNDLTEVIEFHNKNAKPKLPAENYTVWYLGLFVAIGALLIVYKFFM